MAGSFSSSELNLLVYRYLLESGFQHAAYLFGYESFVHKSGVAEREVPPAALITLVQKGMQYIELETNLKEDGRSMEDDFACLSSMEIVTKSVDELRDLIQQRREKRELEVAQLRERLAQSGEAGPREIESAQVRRLEGHRGEVYGCCWNPTDRMLLATSSSDRTARIWNLSKGGSHVELHHPLVKERDVTTLDWSPDGNYLASGSFDGIARIWSKDGALQHNLEGHSGPIFHLRWNKTGTYVLSGSLDKTAAVWSTKDGHMIQQYALHSAPVLDVDWRSDNVFATSSTDRTIQVCKVGEEKPLKVFKGHADEVNSIRWDPQGKLLASCSDDATVKVWSLSQDSCLHNLLGHQKEIYAMRWAPLGPGTANPNQSQLMATASFDTTVRLWEMERGTSVQEMSGHLQAVYSIAFSPDGRYLASASFDRYIRIWSVPDGKMVRTFENTGGIFEVAWNKDGSHLAACSEDRVITVLDMRK